jgi:class 3 adenylate cyclase
MCDQPLQRRRDAEQQPIRESAFRAIMFTDIANSTDIMNQLGDESWVGRDSEVRNRKKKARQYRAGPNRFA